MKGEIQMISIKQLCHIYNNDNNGYEDAVVTAIYDEYIILQKKSGGNMRLSNVEDHDSRVKFLHKNGQPVLIRKGFFGYKFP
jgi:hypothetical protein